MLLNGGFVELALPNFSSFRTNRGVSSKSQQTATDSVLPLLKALFHVQEAEMFQISSDFLKLQSKMAIK